MKNSAWWVYIIETQTGTLYTGVTVDLHRRLRQHKGEIQGGAKYLKSRVAKDVVYKKKYNNRSEAQQIESRIKKLSREAKIILIEKKTRLRPIRKKSKDHVR